MDDEFYLKDGKQYNRPTRILDFFTPPYLTEWKIAEAVKFNLEKRKKDPNANITSSNMISKNALKHGSRVDDLIRKGLEATSKDSSEIKSCIYGFKKWKAEYNVNDDDIVFPATYFNDELMVAGTGDFYWKKNDQYVDIKSAKSIHENNYFQLGFYSLDEIYNTKSVAVLRLDKDCHDYEFVSNEKIGLSLADCRQGFFDAFNHYESYNKVSILIEPRKPIEEMI